MFTVRLLIIEGASHKSGQLLSNLDNFDRRERTSSTSVTMQQAKDTSFLVRNSIGIYQLSTHRANHGVIKRRISFLWRGRDGPWFDGNRMEYPVLNRY